MSKRQKRREHPGNTEKGPEYKGFRGMKADGPATTAAHDACQPRRKNGPKIAAAASLTRKRERVRRWALVALENGAKPLKHWLFRRSDARAKQPRRRPPKQAGLVRLVLVLVRGVKKARKPARIQAFRL